MGTTPSQASYKWLILNVLQRGRDNLMTSWGKIINIKGLRPHRFVRFREPKKLRSLMKRVDLKVTTFAARLRSTKCYERDVETDVRLRGNASRIEADPERPRRKKEKDVSVSRRTLTRALEGSAPSRKGQKPKDSARWRIAEDAANAIKAELQAAAKQNGLDLDNLTLLDIGAVLIHSGQGAELNKKLRTAENRIELMMTEVIYLAWQWLHEGEESHPEISDFPLHPELVYRFSGKWRGWNNFFGIQEDSPEYAENVLQDTFEDRVFVLVGMVLEKGVPVKAPPREAGDSRAK